MKEEGHHLLPGIGCFEDSHLTLLLTLCSSHVPSGYTAIPQHPSTPAAQQQGLEALVHGIPTEDHYHVPAQGTERTWVDLGLLVSHLFWKAMDLCGGLWKASTSWGRRPQVDTVNPGKWTRPQATVYMGTLQAVLRNPGPL